MANPFETMLQVLRSIVEEVDLYIVTDHHKIILVLIVGTSQGITIKSVVLTIREGTMPSSNRVDIVASLALNTRASIVMNLLADPTILINRLGRVFKWCEKSILMPHLWQIY